MYIELSNVQVAIAAAVILVNGLISLSLKLGLEKSLLIASLRTIVQLTLIGFVLKWVFEVDEPLVVLAILALMTVVAGLTAWKRIRFRYPGMMLNTLISMWASSWVVLAFAMVAVLQSETSWSNPQYVIPLLGMLLGNTLNGITLGLGGVLTAFQTQRGEIEMLLSLGASRWEAASRPIQDSIRTGMIPIINSMMVVGLVSLPGMMTGQLLSGTDPIDAVKYQIVIMFLIASATALGVVGVVLGSYWRLFDSAHRFQYDRLHRLDR